ncbi:MAG: hypothetical protein CR977_00665 [Gammaproteobacteria bacterium]|nr:MAG: hypothetical protein CR977_00665 [Gammaproteobacteria bacterium]
MLIYFLLAIVLGIMISLQAGVNSALSGGIGSSVWAAVISFAVGTLLLLIYALLSQPLLPLKKLPGLPPYLFIGGVLGAIYVLSVIVLFAKIGAMNIVIFTVMGQMLFALIIDHYGWFGAHFSPVNWQKIAALAVMLVAVVWFQKSRG